MSRPSSFPGDKTEKILWLVFAHKRSRITSNYRDPRFFPKVLLASNCRFQSFCLQGRRVRRFGSVHRLRGVDGLGRLFVGVAVVVVVVVLAMAAVLVVPFQLGLEGVIFLGKILLPVVAGSSTSVTPFVDFVSGNVYVLKIVTCGIISIFAGPWKAERTFRGS